MGGAQRPRPMRVAVVGGTGFIGSNLVLRLADAGHHVTVFDVSAPRGGRPSGTDFEPCDTTSKKQVQGRLRGFQRVFLLAGVLERGCRERPVESWQVNVEGTANVVAELVAASPSAALCFFSSARVYRPVPRHLALSENGLVHSKSAYAAAKLAGEYMIRSAAASAGLRAAVLRPFSVYGPGPAEGGRGHFVANWLERAATGRPLQLFGSGRQVVDLVHVADVCALCERWLELESAAGCVHTFNVGSGYPATVSDVARWFQEECPDLRSERVPTASAASWEGFADMSRVAEVLRFRPAVTPEQGVRTLVRERLQPSTA